MQPRLVDFGPKSNGERATYCSTSILAFPQHNPIIFTPTIELNVFKKDNFEQNKNYFQKIQMQKIPPQ